MEPSLPRLNYLLQRYVHSEATPSERLELMEALKAGQMEEDVKQWIAAEMEAYDRKESGLSEERAGNLLTGIFQSGRIASGLGERQPEEPADTAAPGDAAPGKLVPMRQARRQYWYVAAAALLLVGLGGYRLWEGKDRREVIARRSERPDVLPGKHAAVLTLAGGQQVLLDSAAADTISRQGNTAIINQNGRLAFTGLPVGAGAELMYNTLTTNPGNQYQLVLPDGTRVWLNAASSIRFPASFGGKERRVEVTGEAYFEVAANASKPFFVQHDSLTVKVLGTSFNINTYSNEATVATTLVEGAIRVGYGSNSQVLRPGQQARTGVDGHIVIMNDVSTDEIVAWKDDLFYFRSADIESIMRQLARWYDVRIAYGQGKIGERFYARIPRNARLSEVLDALSLTGKVHFNIEGRTVSVSP
ncbi:MAG TPA: FecR family protein [Puia sp.]|jgi:ferric-dicitrate binding protein FerR (iron transport regulator)